MKKIDHMYCFPRSFYLRIISIHNYWCKFLPCFFAYLNYKVMLPQILYELCFHLPCWWLSDELKHSTSLFYVTVQNGLVESEPMDTFCSIQRRSVGSRYSHCKSLRHFDSRNKRCCPCQVMRVHAGVSASDCSRPGSRYGEGCMAGGLAVIRDVTDLQNFVRCRYRIWCHMATEKNKSQVKISFSFVQKCKNLLLWKCSECTET